jgi:luciferase family oxidoreductase group 1
LKLSIVDLAPVPAGGSAADALANSVQLARLAERWGYSRYWVAEHHGRGETIASSNPEILVARIAAATTSIRVGSGGVLLNHYSPFKVAEMFRVLHALYPDRIDLGFGRADGLPVVDYAMQTNRQEHSQAPPSPVEDHLSGMMAWMAHDEQVSELVAWLDGTFPAGHPFADIALLPGVTGGPEPWLLGSSPSSAALAGRLGLRYCYAGFINPRGAANAVQTYRHMWEPAMSPAEPYVMLAVNVSCGETDEEGDRLRSTVEAFYHRARQGDVRRQPLPDPDEAIAELGRIPEPSEVAPGNWPQHISGGPARVRDLLETMTDEIGAEEIVIQDMIARPAERTRSYDLIAGAFELATAGQQASAGRG